MVSWRVIPGIETHNASLNMALDESCSESVSRGDVPPTIRFYRWNPSAVSIGYFQKMEEEIDTNFCRQNSIDWVRRRTGGGAVYHDFNGEITYSVIAPEKLFPKDLIASYREICGWITQSLSLIGIQSEFHPINDILAGGKKISGNAQTRRNNILLQHGTILYDLDVETMFQCLKVPKEKISDKMVSDVKQRVTRVLDHAQVSREELHQALEKGFTEGKEWKFGEWSPAELDRANELVVERYANREWNFWR